MDMTGAAPHPTQIASSHPRMYSKGLPRNAKIKLRKAGNLPQPVSAKVMYGQYGTVGLGRAQ
jgi:hypothetical protein